VKERSILAIIIITIVLLGIGYFVATQLDMSILLPAGASAQSVLIDRLFRLLMGIATVVFLLVEGALLYAVLRFRRKPGQEGEGRAFHGNNALEIVWTVIPAIIVTAIGIYSYQVLTRIEEKQVDPLVVQVIGRQFSWEFIYPESGVRTSVLHLPVDQPVLFQIESRDVIHSFWVPEFRIKRDATPGQIDDLVITPIHVGRFPIRCAELCGPGHAAMTSEVLVEPVEDFEAWLASGGTAVSGDDSASTPAGGAEPSTQEGRALFVQYGCGACHLLSDAGGAGQLGPPLDSAGDVAAVRKSGMDAAHYIEESILDPDAFIVTGYPSGLMPGDYAVRMTSDEVQAMVDYLLSQ
jgi:cytochrome c oxidase subunit 2